MPVEPRMFRCRFGWPLLTLGVVGCTEPEVQWYGFWIFVALILIYGAAWLWHHRT